MITNKYNLYQKKQKKQKRFWSFIQPLKIVKETQILSPTALCIPRLHFYQ